MKNEVHIIRILSSLSVFTVGMFSVHLIPKLSTSTTSTPTAILNSEVVVPLVPCCHIAFLNGVVTSRHLSVVENGVSRVKFSSSHFWYILIKNKVSGQKIWGMRDFYIWIFKLIENHLVNYLVNFCLKKHYGRKCQLQFFVPSMRHVWGCYFRLGSPWRMLRMIHRGDCLYLLVGWWRNGSDLNGLSSNQDVCIGLKNAKRIIPRFIISFKVWALS